eukprot:GEMP01056378.1.p1 GENE.GEMP01056378.1~~GEMP01056378.1.p1  ORF type:complete len:125 (+),score=14.64 GEMP01056378.1:112-486(+)
MALIEQGLLILLLLLDLHSRIYPTQPTMTCVCPECVCPECVVPEEKRSSRNLMQDLRSLNLQRLNVGGNDVPPTQQHSTADGRGDYDPYRTAHPTLALVFVTLALHMSARDGAHFTAGWWILKR